MNSRKRSRVSSDERASAVVGQESRGSTRGLEFRRSALLRSPTEMGPVNAYNSSSRLTDSRSRKKRRFNIPLTVAERNQRNPSGG